MRTHAGTDINYILGAVALAVAIVLLADAPTSASADTQTSAAEARIDAPTAGAQVDGVVEIRGRAIVPEGRRFAYYRLLIGVGKAPAIMRPLGPAYDQPVENGVLATWDKDRFPSDEYQLTLQVYTTDDEYESASALVIVKAKPTPTPLPLAVPSVIGASIFAEPSVP